LNKVHQKGLWFCFSRGSRLSIKKIPSLCH